MDKKEQLEFIEDSSTISLMLSKPIKLATSIKIFLISEAIALGFSLLGKFLLSNFFLKFLMKLVSPIAMNGILIFLNSSINIIGTLIDVLQFVNLIIINVGIVIILANPKSVTYISELYNQSVSEDETLSKTALFLAKPLVDIFKMTKNYLKSTFNISLPIRKIPQKLIFAAEVRIALEIVISILIILFL